MTDVHTTEQRSRNMAAIKGKNTSPEIKVRRLLHALGYRYRLHVRSLPGCPDIVLPKHHAVIFVHGCFWHMHKCRYGRVVPATNTEFWQNKRKGNVERNKRTLRKLRTEWRVLEVWECWTKEPEKLRGRITTFLAK